MDENRHQPPDSSRQVKAQHADRISLRGVLLITGGFLLAILIILGLSALLISFFIPVDSPVNLRTGPDIQIGEAPPEPRLQANPAQDMAELRASQLEVIQGYSRIEGSEGVVRIPVERAMAILVERGMPSEDRAAISDEVLEPDESGFPHPVLAADRPLPSTDPAAINPFDFDASLLAGSDQESPLELLERATPEEGQQHYQELGCGGCHTGQLGAAGPDLAGIFGQEEQMEGGEIVVVDEAYLLESIVDPNVKIVAGFQPIMPSYSGRASPEQIAALIVYIRSLGQ